MRLPYLLGYIALSAFASVLGAQAQETFDLNSQRSEVQDIRQLTGHKVDRKGFTLNPTPHYMQVTQQGQLDLSQGITLAPHAKEWSSHCNFIPTTPKGGVPLSIQYGKKWSSRKGIKAVAGSYALEVTPKGIFIYAYDKDGAYYGLRSLEQLIECPAAKWLKIPFVTIYDYPSLPVRGVVEGFYGTPWSHQMRLSLIELYGKYKMNYYVYGPKDDPYHSTPNWREPYPQDQADKIKDLIAACNKNRVHFVWAIHPGQDIKWNEEDYQRLLAKFGMMYDLGVRGFSIFFDDISGEGTNPRKQVELLNRLNKEFVKAKGDVEPLILCPTDYSKLWANPSENGPLAIYGRELDPSISVFWTGDVVCSDLTTSTMQWVNSRIKRPALFWWNFPVTDYCRHILMQGPAYGLEPNFTEQDVRGVLSNPMEHGEASKIALYSTADYAWNTNNYNPIDSWERGIVALFPENPAAYRTFAIHACDTETGYRRQESWETQTFRFKDYSPQLAQDLKKEFERIVKVPVQMRSCTTGKNLVQEIDPWLTEFGKLGERGLRTLELMETYRAGNDAAFWALYVSNIMTPQQIKDYNAHKIGTLKLQPFYENAMDDLADLFYRKLTGKRPATVKPISSFANITTTLAKNMLDGDTLTHYSSLRAQSPDSWIGVDLGAVTPVYEVEILQGRNSYNDVDYFDNAQIEYSLDAQTWRQLTGALEKTYNIYWKGEPVQARYIRLKRLQSKRTNYASVRSFRVNPLRPEALPIRILSDAPEQYLKAFDANLTTATAPIQTLSFTRQQGAQWLHLLAKLPTAAKAKLIQCNAQGQPILEAELTQHFTLHALDAETAIITIEGNGLELSEVLFQ